MEVIQEALVALDPQVRAALEAAVERVRLVHAAQLRTESTVEVTPGGSVTQRWLPVDRVGLYVPGGRAVYPSSVVMNVVPAQLAGVGSIAVTSPRRRTSVGGPIPQCSRRAPCSASMRCTQPVARRPLLCSPTVRNCPVEVAARRYRWSPAGGTSG